MDEWPFKQTIYGLAELECHSDADLTAVVSILDPETPSRPRSQPSPGTTG